MKFRFVLSVLLLSAISLSAQRTNRNIGIILGDPTGVSGKYWLNDTQAFDLAISWRTGTIGELNKSDGKTSLSLHSTYLIHDYSVFSNKHLPAYFGVGGTVTLQQDLAVGIRGAVGIDYLFPNIPLDAFIEFAPSFYLIPSSVFRIGFGLGIRYHF